MGTVTIYSNNAGRVMHIDPPKGHDQSGMLPLEIDDWDGFEAHTAIVTAVGLERHAKVQFRDMFDSSVYVYAFGDKLIDLVISGLLFAKRCPKPNAPDEDAGPHGIDGVMQYYSENAVHIRPTPVIVKVGQEGMHAVLHGVQAHMHDSESGIGKFVLMFKAIKKKD